ncbi:phage tail tape measure protein [Streptomyces sp. NPDC005283]|uniref:phage tail tape measure protein n=1 Tax=Streptomyces sp. NPDC005283 TaxID=3156871 RepID=UPI003455C75F
MPNIGFATIQVIPSVRGIGNQLRQQLVGPAGDAGTEAGDSAGGSLKDKFKLGAAAAGVAAGAILVAGVTEAMDQANIKGTLQAQLGTTDAVAAAQGKVAGKLFSTGVTGSFQEAADAIKTVVQGGLAPPGATNKQLQAIATKASDVAGVFGQDLGGVTNAVAQMMRTGLAKNSTEAFDLITKGFQSGADKGGDLLDTMNEYSVQFKRVGLDGQTAMGLISQGLKGGARDSDQVADAIGQFGERALAGGTAVDDAYKSIGLNAGDVAKKIGAGGQSAEQALGLTLDALRGTKDEQVKLNAAAALFGDPANIMGDALYKLNPATAAASAGLDKAGGATDKLGKTIRSGPAHEISVFTRGLQQGFVDVLGGAVLPAIQDAAHWLNDNLGPAVKGIADAFSATVKWFKEWGIWLTPLAIIIGGVTLALTANAIASGISTAALWVQITALSVAEAVTGGFAAVMGVLNAVMALNPFVLVAIAVVALGAAMVIAYKKSETFRAIVQAVWSGIQTAALWAWNNVLKPIFNAFKIALQAVGTAASWLWNNAISPVFGWIGDKGKWLWNVAIKPAFDSFKKGMGDVSDKATWLWENVLRPVFGWIGDKGKWLWDKALKPAFDSIKKGIGLVGDSFDKARGFIKTAWDKVEGIAKKPVKFLINTVYNGGIVPVWNKVATAFGADPIKPMVLPKGFATGGRVFGAGTETSDDVPAWLSRNEHVWTAREVRGAGGHGAVMAMRKWAAAGGDSGSPGFADGGGLFGWIGKKVAGAGSAAWDGVKKGASWLKDGMKASAMAGLNSIVKPLIDKISGSASLYRDMVTGIPKKMLNAIFDFSGKADKKGAGGIGGPGVQHALSWARSQAGKPYIWGGAGPAGFDCSGLQGSIENVIRGVSPNSRRWATGSFSGKTAPPGWILNGKSPFQIGITNAGVGHTAGTLGGVNVESRGGDGVVVGGRARGYNNGMFTSRYGFVPAKKFDSGGWLQPGATAAFNATGRPEAVLTARQWQVARASVASAGHGGGTFEGDLYLDSGEFMGKVHGVMNQRDQQLISAARAGRRGN